jgi:predicted nucleic acid-binding protein
MLLPDVNVWLALTFDSHIHHSAAKRWFDVLSNEVCFFCRLTQQGFLRLASNAKVFGPHAVPLPEAWRLYDIYLTDQRRELSSFDLHQIGIAEDTLYESYGPAAFLAIDVHDDRGVTGREVHGCFDDHEVGTELREWVGVAVRDQLDFDYRRVSFC